MVLRAGGSHDPRQGIKAFGNSGNIQEFALHFHVFGFVMNMSPV